MTCVRMMGGIVCMADNYGVKFNVAGTTHVIEEHRFFGPNRLTKDGNVYKRFWGEKHPFWDHYNAWCQQGKQVDENENAVYDMNLYVRKETIDLTP